MTTETIQLTEDEARILHAVERSIAYWDKEVEDLNYAGRNENERDMAVDARTQFEELRYMIVNRAD